jgi:hypothetical protein
MSNQIQLNSDYIKKLHPLSVVKDPMIGDHFVNKFVAMYRVPKEQAIAFHEREKDNFLKRITESEDIAACTPMSIFLAYFQVGGWKLSFEGGKQADVYLIPGSVNVGSKENPVWEKQVVAQPSPYGEKKIRIQNGQLKDAAKPVIVYEGDHYREFLGADGNLRVEWEKGDRGDVPKIIGSFIRLEKPDGSYEFKTFGLDDIAKWRSSSEKKNAKWDPALGRKVPGKANALYTSNGGQIDKLFLEGKTLTHSFKGYSRVVNTPNLPETFVPNQEAAVRQGFDTSEFTEDVTHEELTQSEQDDFDEALNQAKQEKKEATVTIENNVDDDDIDF